MASLTKLHSSVKCKAHSSRTGKPCTNWAIQGGTVCRNHGGSAPQVKQAARERLAALVEPSINVISKTLTKSKREDLRFAAAKDVLDRNGYSGKQKVEMSGELGVSAKFDFSRIPPEQLETLRSILSLARVESGVDEAAPEEMA